jgi:DNA-binding transcriptional regulator LsrR (DeoR family)
MREGPDRRLGIVLLLLVLAVVVTGCGVGPATNEEKISKTATTYLRALARSDTVTACAQLTSRAQGESCARAMKERLAGLDPEALDDAADGSIEIDVDGRRATASLSELEGAQFVLVKTNDEWRIDSGYTLD